MQVYGLTPFPTPNTAPPHLVYVSELCHDATYNGGQGGGSSPHRRQQRPFLPQAALELGGLRAAQGVRGLSGLGSTRDHRAFCTAR